MAGRTTKLTQDEVFAVITALVESGTPPNGPNIRTALGNRGSPPVLQRFLGEWFESYGASFADKVRAAGPVPDLTIKSQLQEASARAFDEIDRYREEQEKGLRLLEDALQIRSMQLDERDRVISERQDAFEQLAPTLRAQVERATHELYESQAAEAEVRAELTGLRQSAAEMTAASTAAEQRHQLELEQLRFQLETEVAARSKLETELVAARDQHQSEGQAAAAAIANTQRARAETQVRLEGALETIDRQRSEMADLIASHQTTEARFGEMVAGTQAALKAVSEQRDAAEKARAGLAIEVETGRALLDAAQRSRDAIEERATEASRQLDAVLAGLGRLEHIEKLVETIRSQTADRHPQPGSKPGSPSGTNE